MRVLVCTCKGKIQLPKQDLGPDVVLEQHDDLCKKKLQIKSDEKVVIAGLSGTLLISTDKSMSFKTVNRPDRKGISALLPAGGQKLLLFGEGGINQDVILSSH